LTHLVLPRRFPGITDSGVKTISLKLPDSLLLLLEQESRHRRTNKSALVRAALERELSEAKRGDAGSCHDLAHDLAGCLKGLPKDLSTNSRHMEGFGR